MNNSNAVNKTAAVNTMTATSKKAAAAADKKAAAAAAASDKKAAAAIALLVVLGDYGVLKNSKDEILILLEFFDITIAGKALESEVKPAKKGFRKAYHTFNREVISHLLGLPVVKEIGSFRSSQGFYLPYTTSSNGNKNGTQIVSAVKQLVALKAKFTLKA